MILGHDSRLGQVFNNLIDNARSFSAPGGSVRVLLRPAKDYTAQGHVRDGFEIIIDDDGPGIPADAFERIFERFYTDRPDQGFGQNSGLGLSISRQIIEVHGGHISALNRVGPPGPDGVIPVLGARFLVFLPQGAIALSTLTETSGRQCGKILSSCECRRDRRSRRAHFGAVRGRQKQLGSCLDRGGRGRGLFRKACRRRPDWHREQRRPPDRPRSSRDPRKDRAARPRNLRNTLPGRRRCPAGDRARGRERRAAAPAIRTKPRPCHPWRGRKLPFVHLRQDAASCDLAAAVLADPRLCGKRS